MGAVTRLSDITKHFISCMTCHDDTPYNRQLKKRETLAVPPGAVPLFHRAQRRTEEVIKEVRKENFPQNGSRLEPTGHGILTSNHGK